MSNKCLFRSSRFNTRFKSLMKFGFFLNLIFSIQASAAEMCKDILISTGSNAKVAQKTLRLENVKTVFREKGISLVEEIKVLESRLTELKNTSRIGKTLELITKGPSVAKQIKALEVEIKDKTEKQKNIPLRLRSIHVRIASELSMHLENSFRQSVHSLFVDPAEHTFTVLKKDPIRYLPDNKVGLPITVVDKELNQTFNLIAILDFTDKVKLLQSDIQWFALVDSEIFNESPSFYINVKVSKALDAVDFKPVANSKIVKILSKFDIHSTSETLDGLNYKYSHSALTKRAIETIIGFTALSNEYGKGIHKPLLESFLQLISLNPEDPRDANASLKNFPVSAILLTQALDVASQDQVTALNLAIIKKIKESGNYPLKAQYFSMLKANLPGVYREIAVSADLNKTDEVTDKLSLYFPGFEISDYKVSTTYMAPMETKIWQIGMKFISRGELK